MTISNSDPQTQAVRRAARRFAEDLSAKAMLAATIRVEAWLSAEGPDSLFAVDEALAAAWRRAGRAHPRHEVIWASGAGEGLRLSAFDAAGRVLLRRSYAATTRRGGGHV
jgi:hypothetical protein